MHGLFMNIFFMTCQQRHNDDDDDNVYFYFLFPGEYEGVLGEEAKAKVF